MVFVTVCNNAKDMKITHNTFSTFYRSSFDAFESLNFTAQYIVYHRNSFFSKCTETMSGNLKESN